jgi:hypothetical protein
VKLLKDVGISEFLNSEYRKSRGQEIRSLHSENLDFDPNRPSVETHGGDQEPIDISTTGVLS